MRLNVSLVQIRNIETGEIMAGLREKKKKMIREKILSVSKELFLTAGYDQTTTSKIASKAEVAEGTLYNYFRSKSEIFISIFGEAFSVENIKTSDYDETLTLAQNIAAFMDEYLWVSAYKDKAFIKELFKTLLNDNVDGEKMATCLFGIDRGFVDIFKTYLDTMKEAGYVNENADIFRTSELIYSVIMLNTFKLVMEPEFEFENCKDCVDDQVEYICSNMLTKGTVKF